MPEQIIASAIKPGRIPMVLDVGSIDITKHSPTREAETADARLQKRRKNPEYHQNEHKKKKKGSNTPINVSDLAENTISIDAIYDFLTDIAHSNTSPGQSIDESPTELPSMFHAIAKNKIYKIRKNYESAKAASAYEHAAHTAQNAKTHNIDQSNRISLGLENISNKKLNTLIKDLKALRKQGLQSISIRKKNNFLESLITAVEEEKAK